jgi:hypothetical protein
MKNDELDVEILSISKMKDNEIITYKTADEESLESLKKIREVYAKYDTEMSFDSTKKVTELDSQAENVAISSSQ